MLSPIPLPSSLMTLTHLLEGLKTLRFLSFSFFLSCVLLARISVVIHLRRCFAVRRAAAAAQTTLKNNRARVQHEKQSSFYLELNRLIRHIQIKNEEECEQTTVYTQTWPKERSARSKS